MKMTALDMLAMVEQVKAFRLAVVRPEINADVDHLTLVDDAVSGHTLAEWYKSPGPYDGWWAILHQRTMAGDEYISARARMVEMPTRAEVKAWTLTKLVDMGWSIVEESIE